MSSSVTDTIYFVNLFFYRSDVNRIYCLVMRFSLIQHVYIFFSLLTVGSVMSCSDAHKFSNIRL